VLTAVLWLVVSLGLNIYLQVAADANPVLGVLGGGLILLIWLYLLSVSLLLGGELNPVLQRYRAGERGHSA
jgi:membrane protein